MGNCSGSAEHVDESAMELSNVNVQGNRGKTMVIHLVRHGEAKHNVHGKIPGNYLRPSLADAALTDFGIVQCEELNKQLLNSHIGDKCSCIFVSPMERTLQTATIGLSHIISKPVKIVAIEFLREETGLFPCDRRNTKTYYEQKYPMVDFSRIEESDPLYYKYIFRERKADVQFRCDEVLKQIRQLQDNEIVIVSHSAFLMQLLTKLLRSGKIISANQTLSFKNAECKSVEVSF